MKNIWRAISPLNKGGMGMNAKDYYYDNNLKYNIIKEV